MLLASYLWAPILPWHLGWLYSVVALGYRLDTELGKPYT